MLDSNSLCKAENYIVFTNSYESSFPPGCLRSMVGCFVMFRKLGYFCKVEPFRCFMLD